MTPRDKEKLLAAGKMAYGAARCASGGMLLLGHGLLSHVFTRTSARLPVSKYLIDEGSKLFKEGLSEWKDDKP